MRKLFAISLLFIFISANTAFGQIWRLPELLHHFIEHNEKDQTTFVEFLQLHYGEKINHPDDQHQHHQKLPFKAIHVNVTQTLSIPNDQAIAIEQIVFEQPTPVLVISHQFLFSSDVLSSIWQPPRIG